MPSVFVEADFHHHQHAPLLCATCDCMRFSLRKALRSGLAGDVGAGLTATAATVSLAALGLSTCTTGRRGDAGALFAVLLASDDGTPTDATGAGGSALCKSSEYIHEPNDSPKLLLVRGNSPWWCGHAGQARQSGFGVRLHFLQLELVLLQLLLLLLPLLLRALYLLAPSLLELQDGHLLVLKHTLLYGIINFAFFQPSAFLTPQPRLLVERMLACFKGKCFITMDDLVASHLHR